VRSENIPQVSEEWECSSWQYPNVVLSLIRDGYKVKIDYRETLEAFLLWKD
jgi:hypothetical protein